MNKASHYEIERHACQGKPAGNRSGDRILLEAGKAYRARHDPILAVALFKGTRLGELLAFNGEIYIGTGNSSRFDGQHGMVLYFHRRAGRAAYGREPATYTQSGRKKGHALPSVSVECQWLMLPARAIISITAPRFDRHGPLSAPLRALQQSPSNRISSWTFPFSIAVYHPPSHGKEMSFNVLIVACGTWIRKKGWAACFNPHGNSPGRSCPAVYFPA